MLCVPRSWAASPWVIDRMTVILSAIWAVCGRVSLKTSPSILVGIVAQLAAILDRRVGLGVERLLVGDAARQEDVDDRVGLGRDRRVVLQLGPGLEPEEVGQASGRSRRPRPSGTRGG